MRVPLLATVLLAGCGSGVDLTGLYMMTSSALDASGCGPGMPMSTPADFRVVKGSGASGVPFLTFQFCTSTDTSTCTPMFAMPLLAQIANGWRGDESVADSSGASCALAYIAESATLSGASLRFERHTYSQSNVQGVACKTQDAAARGTSMPCTGSQLLVGDRVGN